MPCEPPVTTTDLPWNLSTSSSSLALLAPLVSQANLLTSGCLTTLLLITAGGRHRKGPLHDEIRPSGRPLRPEPSGLETGDARPSPGASAFTVQQPLPS